ncbi:phage repressor protein C with HTH and peptisase S24 domain [Novosphingobium sediminicola]|uniref:Phage repressor protein C with HTH and peptisase S24 domain n=1 Tax=Novosphingobium sediminicola TaxID=563162 RepID=A0A7W6CCQ1_9SPHN|nr:S24 family peptidase [Novosphingobium sediminicola]MBB3953417.1 phage repressor protein C with HTH and peptisase S24 domain [Novosphingobium sediminicola]
MASYSCFYSSVCVSIGDRINSQLKALNLSQAELARRVGVAQPTINNLINRNKVGTKYLHKIAAELRTTPAYLSGETDDPSEGYVAPPSIEVVAEDLGLVPVREFDLTLGMGASFLDSEPNYKVQHFPREWLRAFTHSPPEDLFFAHAVGDSMQPTMVSGDIVLIDRRQQVVDNADLIWAMTYEGMGMIKRIGPARGGQIEIISDNQSVRSRFVMPEDVHIIGRIVAVVRKM